MSVVPASKTRAMLGWSIIGQGLALGLEPGDDLAAVHARLDDLERDLAADGLLLLGHVDDAHAPLADLLEQLVGADPRARSFGEPVVPERDRRRGERLLQEAAGLLVRPEQALDPGRRSGSPAQAPSRKAGARRARLFQGESEDRLVRRIILKHGWNPPEEKGLVAQCVKRAENLSRFFPGRRAFPRSTGAARPARRSNRGGPWRRRCPGSPPLAPWSGRRNSGA